MDCNISTGFECNLGVRQSPFLFTMYLIDLEEIIFIPRANDIQKSIAKPRPDIQIVNLSNRKLNKTELKLLQKG